jgi:orotidine 5'-phosphate decarboxylase subfamily 1
MSKLPAAKDRIIFAMDVSDPETTLRFVEELDGAVGCLKFGLEFYWSLIANLLEPPRKTGTEEEDTEWAKEVRSIEYLRLYRSIHKACGKRRIFKDPKLDDIPNTVAGASVAISRLHPLMFNVHASAGEAAIKAAVANRGESWVLGVTVLTSLDEQECISIFGDTPSYKVLEFAKKLEAAGAQGVVCSPKEARELREKGIGLRLVCPGIQPAWMPAKNDQARPMTPGEAERAGVDYQVIGRAISQRWESPLVNVETARSPSDTIDSPRAAAEVIALEIEQARAA